MGSCAVDQKTIPSVLVDREAFLFNNRILYLKGEIASENSNVFDETTDIIASLLVLDKLEIAPIVLYVDSLGGSVYTGLALYDVIRSLKSPVYTVGVGLVASIAVVVLVAGERRFCFPNTRVFVHEPWRWSGDKESATELEIEAGEMKVLKARIQSILACRTGQNIETIRKDTSRNKYFSAQEAIKYGIIHEMIRGRNGKRMQQL